jgi:hypothetical protein
MFGFRLKSWKIWSNICIRSIRSETEFGRRKETDKRCWCITISPTVDCTANQEEVKPDYEHKDEWIQDLEASIMTTFPPQLKCAVQISVNVWYTHASRNCYNIKLNFCKTLQELLLEEKGILCNEFIKRFSGTKTDLRIIGFLDFVHRPKV